MIELSIFEDILYGKCTYITHFINENINIFSNHKSLKKTTININEDDLVFDSMHPVRNTSSWQDISSKGRSGSFSWKIVKKSRIL